MKKILAIAIVAVMATALCISAFAANHAIVESAGGVGVWMRSGSESVTVKFTTTGSFTGLNFNSQYWASCIATTTGSEADWKVELYKFAYNTENTLAQSPVATKEVHSTADNTPAFEFSFNAQPAGTYIVKVTLTNPDHEEEVGGEMKKPYLVLPAVTNPDASKFEFSREAFNLVVIGDEGSEFFAANPEEVATPAEQPAETAKAVLSINADKLYELFETATAVNTLTAEKKDGYVAFTPEGDDPFFPFAEPLNPGVDAKYAVVKYRINSEGDRTVDFYLKIAEPHAQSDKLTCDGEWHYMVMDLSRAFPDSMETLWDGTIARLDPLSGNGIAGTEIDIASIEFFTSEADAQASTGGSSTPTTPETTPHTADASVIAIAAVACIALAGVVIAKKVR